MIIISDSEPDTERIEDVGDRRDRKRDRNVWAGRIFGGVWARNLVISLLYLVNLEGWWTYGRTPFAAYGPGSCAPFPHLRSASPL